MTWEQRSPFSAAAGAVGGFLGGQQEAKRYAEEQARQAMLDKQNAATLAAQAAYEQAQTRKIGREGQQEAGVQSYRKGVGDLSKLNLGKTPEDQIKNLTRMSVIAQMHGDNETASILSTLASNTALEQERTAAADYTTHGRLPEARANIGKTNAQTDEVRGWRTRERNKLSIAMRTASDRERVEATRAGQSAQRLATSVHLSGMREGGANERAQMLADSRETMALMAQNFVLNEKMPADQAAKAALAQYQSKLKSWQTQNTLGQAQAAASGQTYTPTEAPSFTPNITINAPPTQQQPQMMVIPITLPDGRKTTIPVMRPLAPKAQAKPKTQAKAHPKPVAPQATGGPLDAIGHALHAFIFGS